jgi:hypothetical protein
LRRNRWRNKEERKHKNWTEKVKMENFINLEESREI